MEFDGITSITLSFFKISIETGADKITMKTLSVKRQFWVKKDKCDHDVRLYVLKIEYLFLIPFSLKFVKLILEFKDKF